MSEATPALPEVHQLPPEAMGTPNVITLQGAEAPLQDRHTDIDTSHGIITPDAIGVKPYDKATGRRSDVPAILRGQGGEQFALVRVTRDGSPDTTMTVVQLEQGDDGRMGIMQRPGERPRYKTIAPGDATAYGFPGEDGQRLFTVTAREDGGVGIDNHSGQPLQVVAHASMSGADSAVSHEPRVEPGQKRTGSAQVVSSSAEQMDNGSGEPAASAPVNPRVESATVEAPVWVAVPEAGIAVDQSTTQPQVTGGRFVKEVETSTVPEATRDEVLASNESLLAAIKEDGSARAAVREWLIRRKSGAAAQAWDTFVARHLPGMTERAMTDAQDEVARTQVQAQSLNQLLGAAEVLDYNFGNAEQGISEANVVEASEAVETFRSNVVSEFTDPAVDAIDIKIKALDKIRDGLGLTQEFNEDPVVQTAVQGVGELMSRLIDAREGQRNDALLSEIRSGLASVPTDGSDWGSLETALRGERDYVRESTVEQMSKMAQLLSEGSLEAVEAQLRAEFDPAQAGNLPSQMRGLQQAFTPDTTSRLVQSLHKIEAPFALFNDIGSMLEKINRTVQKR